MVFASYVAFPKLPVKAGSLEEVSPPPWSWLSFPLESPQDELNGIVISCWESCQFPGFELLLHKALRVTLSGTLFGHVNVILSFPETESSLAETWGSPVIGPFELFTINSSTGSLSADSIVTFILFWLCLAIESFIADAVSAAIPKWVTVFSQ